MQLYYHAEKFNWNQRILNPFVRHTGANLIFIQIYTINFVNQHTTEHPKDTSIDIL